MDLKREEALVGHRLEHGIHCGDALELLQRIPRDSVALAVTSPPYWDAKDYGADGQIGQTDYDIYLEDLLAVWRETARVLMPNGKLAVVTPIMPVPKAVIGDQHTRHLKNLNNDIERTILDDVDTLHRYSLFVWQKQTTTKMFGSYPYPPNIYEDNTVEFINVYVKDGPPPRINAEAKQASSMTQEEWVNLTMQVWPMYPADVQRTGGHPCPFPTVLALRLIRMYTFAAAPAVGFPGDVVLDMFNGAGATTLAAAALDRRYVGIDLHPDYCETARRRLRGEEIDPDALFLPRTPVRQAQPDAPQDGE